jgi:hypothetical protein
MTEALGRDVWQVATSLVDLHGAHAPLYAMQSVDQLLERGDFRLAERWRLVWRATEALLRAEPAASDTSH